MRSLWIGSSPLVDTALDDLLDEADARPSQPLAGRELRVELAFASLFVVVAGALAVLAPSPRPLAVGTAVALTLLYAIASRIEFATGVGWTVPTQIVLVPMLFLLPTPAVPIFVAAGLLLGRLPRYLRRQTPAGRAVVELGDSLYVVGPVIVLLLAGADTPTFADWPVYAVALAAQFAGDVGLSTLRAWLGLGAPPGLVSREVAWICIADLLLAPVGFVAALATLAQPHAFLLVLPLLAALALSARDRGIRIRQSRELWSAYRGSVLLIDRVVSADNRSTGEHGRGVVDLSMRVGDELGLAGEDRVVLEFSALLHDVGKVAIDNEIINKRGPLTPDEFAVIRTHTVEAHRMLEEIGGLLGRVGLIVRSCHERWDGTGYPDGLPGESIPQIARIVFCCDAFLAMTTDRSYRAARSPERALAELRANAGTQFDPAVVAALARVLERPGDGPAQGDGHATPGVMPAQQPQTQPPPPLVSDEALLGLAPDGTVLSMNSGAVRLLGWAPEEAVGRTFHELVHHSYLDGAPYPREASPITQALSRRQEHVGQIEVLWRKDGNPLPISYAVRPADDGGPAGATLALKPLVARSPAEEALRLGEELYRSLARNLNNSAVMLFDHDLRLLVLEGAPVTQRELPHEALTQWRLQDVLPEDAWEPLEQPVRAALRGERTEVEIALDDGARHYRVTVGPVRDDHGAVQAGLAVAEDVTQTRHRAERLHRMAHYDELTGLTNRAAFHELAERALRRTARTARMSALVFLDLDGFKEINDSLGHEAGDEVLIAVATRLQATVREIDTVARLGGDEFAVLLDGVHDRSEAAVAAERILAAVAAPLGNAGARGPRLRASIGVALQTSVTETGAELLKAADAAMYTAKKQGGGRVEFFDPDRDRRSRPHDEERDLARAAERGELTLHFQPEIDVESGEVVAVQALVRWMHPDRGLLRPADFLSDAERDGHIVAIDEWVVGAACAQAAAWSREGLGQFRIAVNLSDEHVRQPAFEDTVRRRLDDAGLPAARLELEISERALADPAHPCRSAMHRLRTAGTRVSVDHYGTAETTPASLDALPVDAVKLDGRFVRSLPEDGRRALDLIESAHARGFEVIAGGVETPGQLTMLRKGGCDVAAGHLICHPMTAQELSAWLAMREGG